MRSYSQCVRLQQLTRNDDLPHLDFSSRLHNQTDNTKQF